MSNLVSLMVALLIGVAAGAVLVGVGGAARRRDDAEAADQVLADLRTLAIAAAAPDRRETVRTRAGRIIERIRPGLHTLPAAPAAPVQLDVDLYVHRLLDAYGSGEPLDLSGCAVPPVVEGRLRAIMAAAGERTAPVPAAEAVLAAGWAAVRELGPGLEDGDGADFRDVDAVNATLRERAAVAHGQVVHGGQ